jgi:hypothetical protein
MKKPKYNDIGPNILIPQIKKGRVGIVVEVEGSQDETVSYINSDQLRYLATYIDSLTKDYTLEKNQSNEQNRTK